jgi:hypothetical protein
MVILCFPAWKKGQIWSCQLRLAQEDYLKETKTTKELEKVKSTIRQVASALRLILKDTRD